MEFFGSIFSSGLSKPSGIFIMLAVALLTGILYAWICSFKLKANSRFYIVISMMAMVVSLIVATTNGLLDSSVAVSSGAAIAVAGAFSLVRFRSAQGSSEEIIVILSASGAGLAFGAGYLAYGVIFMIAVALLYLLLASVPVFRHKNKQEERLLIITVPEDLNYHAVFEDSLDHFTARHELIKAKTTNMGSMYKLSYKVMMKNPLEEKEMIDELRTKNGNLDIVVESYDTFSPTTGL